MHKVQMNSSASDTIRARVARFNEFDNGHVLFDYQKMTEEEFEERAKAASIKDPNDVYYVAIDNIMEPGTDVYWFQGKSYDYEGAEKALSDYQKSATSGLNSGRRPLNSSEEQTKVSGIVTIYSDFVDFKRSVSEHLLQTAVGDRAKLKFKWVGDNKVEVKAICSVADERKVKILLENSDVTRTITWNTSANSSRLNSAALQKGDKVRFKQVGGTLSREVGVVTDVYKDRDIGKYDFCTIRWSDGDVSEDVDVDQCVKVGRAAQQYLDEMAALNSSVGSCFATLWSAYIDDEYKCACCGKPFPAGHNSVHLSGHKPDGMHFIFEYTKENREGNGVNYDPYNLPKEDPEGGIFKVVVGEDADDEGYRWLNFCRNCWPKLTSMSPEEIYAKYSPDAKAGGLNSNKGGKSMRKVNSGKISGKKLNSSRSDSYVDVDGIMGSRGDVWTIAELADYWNREQHSDPCLDEYASYEDWLDDTLAAMRPVNSSRKPASKSTRKRLNSSKKSEILELTGWSHDDLAEAFDEWLANGGDEYEEDEQFDAFADAVAEAAELGDTDAFGIPLKASRKMNSSRKVGNNSMRKVIFRGKLNSSRKLNSAAGSNDVSGMLKAALAKTQLPNDFNYSTPRRTDDGMLTTLTVRLPDGSKSWADKCYIEGDLATGDWAFGSYAPDGQQPAAGSFGFQTVSGLDTEAKAVAWLKKQLEDCAKFYKENPPKRIARVLDSSCKRMNSSRTKLNASLVDTFLQYHDDAENYDHQSMNYDELYDKLTTYAKPGENPEGMNVDELFVRAPEAEQRAMIALIDPENWREDFDSSRKLNSSEGESEDDADAGESVGEGADAPASEGETEVQDTSVEGGEDAAETAEILEDALIVQNPETKEVALFVPDADDETVPEDVDVIAEVDVVADETEVLDSSRRLKKFATAKLNSSKGCLNSDADVCPGCGKPYDECECEPGTVAYDEIQLPDDTVVEVENILVVQDDEGELGLFMPEDAEEAVPEGYEVVATATPAAEVDVLDSSRRMKKSNAKKLNSNAKRKNR